MKQSENRKGLIGTLLFHAVVLMGFFLVSLTNVVTPPRIVNTYEVNLFEEPTATGASASNAIATTSNISAPKTLTQDSEKTVDVPRGENKDNTPTKVLSPSQDLLNAFNTSANTQPNTGDQDGASKTKGNTSDPSTLGDDIMMAGRSLIERPIVTDNSTETGKVVVTIVVDKSGKVTKATSGAKGSTTTDEHLNQLAEEAALKARFNANPNAPEQQVGTITFNFILK